MANLLNTTISGTGHITPPASNSFNRSSNLIDTIVRWTTTGVTTLRGVSPTATTTSWTCPANVTSVELLVVAGGGGGSNDHGGGGGAGGVIYRANYSVTPSTTYSLSVGAGGAGGGQFRSDSRGLGVNGGNSTFDSLTAIGGGRSGSYSNGGPAVGGSGGGGSEGQAGAAGTQGQGYPGGSSIVGNAPDYLGAGGGGAGGPGGNVGSTAYTAGGGGKGLGFNITGTLVYYGGGGGGCSAYSSNGNYGAGGLGGGGAGATNSAPAQSGTAGTGGGGGGANRYAAAGNHSAGSMGNGGNGGSGVVILRYVQTSDSTDVRGALQYNTELSGLEVYDNHIDQWTSQDEGKNFGGHNLLTNSDLKGNDLSVEAIWTKTNNSTDVAAPDGSALTTKCVSGTSGNSFFWQTNSITYKTNTVYTESVWVRVASGSGTISFNNGVNANKVINPTTTWQRFSFTYTTTGSSGPVYYLGFVSPSVNTTFYFWGWQLEEGVTSPGPYSPTTTAPSPAPGLVQNYRIHQYTTVGTSSFTPAVSGYVELLVVAGGGGGGTSIYGAGGGGAGGVVYHKNYPVTAGRAYRVTVGAGGGNSTRGSDSVFGPIVAIGGGSTSQHGGSGGGGGHSNPAHPGGGSVIGQGYSGGYHVYSSPYPCGGGGGAGGRGGDGNTSGGPGAGGPGVLIDITGAPVWYAGGGGGTNYNISGAGAGGIGGGGAGVWAGTGIAGTANTGGGGGAGGGNGVGGAGGAGGSGIVVVRYKYN
jgi:hypothetical protein